MDPNPNDPHFPAGFEGSGYDLWTTIVVPDGSCLERVFAPEEEDIDDPDERELYLILPDGEQLDAAEAFQRFGDAGLVRSENEAIKLALNSFSPNLGTN